MSNYIYNIIENIHSKKISFNAYSNLQTKILIPLQFSGEKYIEKAKINFFLCAMIFLIELIS